MNKRAGYIAIITALFGILTTGCSTDPAEIHYGSDECAHCRMMISDSRFAGQIVTEKGKAIKFDAIECLAAYHRTNSENMEAAKIWISSFNEPGRWLPVHEAHIVRSHVIKSPMGEGLLALPSQNEVENHLKEYPGKEIDWKYLQ